MSYWTERQKQLYAELEKDEIELKKRLSSFYDAEEKRIEKEISSFYARYGENNIIEYRKLLEKLSDSEIKLLMQDMDEFANQHPQYAHLLPVRANVYKLDRLEGLQHTVMMQQLEIGAKNNAEITKHLLKQAHRSVNAVQELMGFGKTFYAMNSDIVKSFVNVPWSNGSNFSDKIWANSNKLANYLNTDIAQGFARGDSYDRLVKQVCERFKHVTRKDAYRLIYTEGTYVMAESSMKPFEADYEQYKISTAADGKVCKLCADMAQQVFDIKDRVPGRNFPPFHPWCRCTFEIVVPDWDKWIDDYVKKHSVNPPDEMLKNFSDNDIINKTQTVTNQAIENITYIAVSGLGERENLILQAEQKNLLRQLQNKSSDTEISYIFDLKMDNKQVFAGKKNQVNFISPNYEFLSIHNHPSGGVFSPSDIYSFCNQDKMQHMVVVGNNGNQYILSKTSVSDIKKLYDDYIIYLYNLKNQKLELSEALEKSKEFFKESEKYGFKYIEKN